MLLRIYSRKSREETGLQQFRTNDLNNNAELEDYSGSQHGPNVLPRNSVNDWQGPSSESAEQAVDESPFQCREGEVSTDGGANVDGSLQYSANDSYGVQYSILRMHALHSTR